MNRTAPCIAPLGWQRPPAAHLLLAAADNPDDAAVPEAPGMITSDERRMLARFAERIWSAGADRRALIVDAGCFVGASTGALAALV